MFSLRQLGISILGCLLTMIAVESATIEFQKDVLSVPESVTRLQIPLRLSEGLPENGSIHYVTADGTAMAGADYLATNGILQIQAGSHSVSTNSAILEVSLLQDGERERDETFTIELREPSGPLNLGEVRTLQVRILDNDQGVRFDQENELQVSDVPQTVRVEVLRGDDGSQPVTVEYFTVDGTAGAGSDYVAASGTLTFGADEASKQIELSVLSNDLLETDELFSLVLTNVTGGTLGGPNVRTVRILNGQPSLLTPVLLARHRPTGMEDNGAQGVALQGNYAFVTEKRSALLVFDITNPAAPLPVAHYWLGSPTNNAENSYGIAVNENLAIVANQNGMRVIDIRNPRVPYEMTNSFSVAAGMRPVLSGQHVFLPSHEGLNIVDLSDPWNPKLVSRTAMGGSAMSVAIRETNAFVSVSGSGLQIYDISDLSAPRKIGASTTSRFVHACAVSGDYAFVTGPNTLLQVLSIADPAQPLVVATLTGNVLGNAIRIVGDYAYIADGFENLQVINISRPTAPYLVAGSPKLTEAGGAVDIAVRGRNIFLANLEAGFTTFGIAPTLDPAVPTGEGFQFLLRSLSGNSVRIERSSDFENWQFWKTVTPNREITHLTDAERSEGLVFYRAAVE